MADEDLKASLGIVNLLKSTLKDELNATRVGNEKISDHAINEFVENTKTRYRDFDTANSKNPSNTNQNLTKLYQDISVDFKDSANKLGLSQNQKDVAVELVTKVIKLALETNDFNGLPSAKDIIAEHAHIKHRDVVNDLFTENSDALQKKNQYLQKINDLREGNTENKFDKIAKLNAKLQQDLSLNDRQVNELNIGVSHYINDNRRNFKSDLKGDISREEITKVLNQKTAEIIAQKPTKTRAQAAKSVVIGARKSAKKTITSQWQNPSKSGETLPDATVKISQKREKPAKWKKAERSDKNPQIAASDYRNSQEVDPKSSHINNLHNVSNLDKKQVKQDNKTILSRVLKTIPTTKLERVYDAAVKGIEADVKQKANAKLTEIKSTVSHKMPPEAKEFATKLGQDVSATAHAAAERVKGAKDRIKHAVKKTFER